MLVASLVAALLTPVVDYGLQPAFRTAVDAWAPYQARVASVHWNFQHNCEDESGGGHYEFSTGDIDICYPVIDHPGCKATRCLDLIMAHEYGHALGLYEHVSRKERLSVMNAGWELPYGDVPTDADKAAVAARRPPR